MGYTKYNEASYSTIRASKAYDNPTVTRDQVFTQRGMNEDMNPQKVRFRESRDSATNPSSLAIMIWLDDTGSMGTIPEDIVRNNLSALMTGLMDSGVKDPHVCFGAVGDHKSDRVPLQVGQFESQAELLDKWLTSTYLEGGGGGNGGESYLLPWYFAAQHTSIDCYEKRNEKGFLFTIGDEPTHKSIPGAVLKQICGVGEFKDSYSAQELLAMAKEKYNVYHIHVNDGSYRDNQDLMNGWRELLGDNFIVIQDHKDVAKTIADIAGSNKTVVTATGKDVEVSEMM